MKRVICRYPVVGLLMLLWTGLAVADDDPFMILSGPSDVIQFHLKDEEGKTLWVLEADPPAEPYLLMYGKAPAGFVQTEPAGDLPPRELVPGEVVIMKTTTRKLVFTHTGVASGTANMEIIEYSMKRREKEITPAK